MIESMNTQPHKKFKILLIGDACTDVYQYGTVDRISPEAPIPVFKYSHEERRDGMAGNVARNLETLGCDVDFLHGSVSTKTRLIDLRSRQQIVRIDNDEESSPIVLETAVPPIYDAIVISDYNKGTVSYELIEELRKEFDGPIFVDTKKQDLQRLKGCVVKINELEYHRCVSHSDQTIVTLGERGAKLISYGHETVFPAPEIGVVDVTGAGDTFLAATVVAYLVHEYLAKAIPFAIRASSITVQHLGCYAPTLEEIQ